MNHQQYQKTVHISYVLFCILISFLFLTGLLKVAHFYDLESKIKSIELIIRVFSVLIGVVLFFVLYKNSKVNDYMHEVAVELFTKVTWPTAKDTQAATIVVLIAVTIVGFLLSFLDWTFAVLLKAFWSSAQKWFL